MKKVNHVMHSNDIYPAAMLFESKRINCINKQSGIVKVIFKDKKMYLYYIVYIKRIYKHFF